MKLHLRKFAAGLFAAAFLAGGAAAQPASTATDQAEAASAPVPIEASPFSQAQAASDEVLQKATAREDLSLAARSEQSSNVTGNSVNGTSTTGTISFSDNAFQTASGLTVINANSGNNVSMNASMNVNIVMVPATPQP
jgi:hypothetical protein